jgi:hypothetical protein
VRLVLAHHLARNLLAYAPSGASRPGERNGRLPAAGDRETPGRGIPRIDLQRQIEEQWGELVEAIIVLGKAVTSAFTLSPPRRLATAEDAASVLGARLDRCRVASAGGEV